jgi:polyisoprenyl-teichoic acid--peptidoglycan teichoic acid transferase
MGGLGEIMMRTQTILPRWLIALLAAAFVFTAVVVSAFAYLTAEAFLSRPFNPFDAVLVEFDQDDFLLPLPQIGTVNVPTLPLGEPTPTLIPTSEPWAGTDRINILVMGIDRRPGEAFISRTDTMMLVSLDPESDTISVLSIPRDLYVVIPNRGRDRINTAFVYGSAGNNPAGGAALAMQTVEYNLGVPVNHYIAIDFGAFIGAIDAIGGIHVNVPYDINDPTYPDMNYGYEPLYIPAGRHHFDGAMALKYARTRKQDNDFYRARRQQQVILAARSQVLSLGLAGFLQQAPVLYQRFNDGVRTDLSLEQMIRLAQAASEVPSENIRNEVLDYDYVNSHTTETGASVLVMINNRVAPLIQSLFFEP